MPAGHSGILDIFATSNGQREINAAGSAICEVHWTLCPINSSDAVIEVLAGRWSLGSGSTNRITLDDDSVASSHCLLIASESRLILRSWNERTLVNGEAAKEAILGHGDELGIGTFQFRIEHTPPSTDFESGSIPNEIMQLNSQRPDDSMNRGQRMLSQVDAIEETLRLLEAELTGRAADSNALDRLIDRIESGVTQRRELSEATQRAMNELRTRIANVSTCDPTNDAESAVLPDATLTDPRVRAEQGRLDNVLQSAGVASDFGPATQNAGDSDLDRMQRDLHDRIQARLCQIDDMTRGLQCRATVVEQLAIELDRSTIELQSERLAIQNERAELQTARTSPANSSDGGSLVETPSDEALECGVSAESDSQTGTQQTEIPASFDCGREEWAASDIELVNWLRNSRFTSDMSAYKDEPTNQSVESEWSDNGGVEKSVEAFDQEPDSVVEVSSEFDSEFDLDFESAQSADVATGNESAIEHDSDEVTERGDGASAKDDPNDWGMEFPTTGDSSTQSVVVASGCDQAETNSEADSVENMTTANGTDEFSERGHDSVLYDLAIGSDGTWDAETQTASRESDTEQFSKQRQRLRHFMETLGDENDEADEHEDARVPVTVAHGEQQESEGEVNCAMRSRDEAVRQLDDLIREAMSNDAEWGADSATSLSVQPTKSSGRGDDASNESRHDTARPENLSLSFDDLFGDSSDSSDSQEPPNAENSDNAGFVDTKAQTDDFPLPGDFETSETSIIDDQSGFVDRGMSFDDSNSQDMRSRLAKMFDIPDVKKVDSIGAEPSQPSWDSHLTSTMNESESSTSQNADPSGESDVRLFERGNASDGVTGQLGFDSANRAGASEPAAEGPTNSCNSARNSSPTSGISNKASRADASQEWDASDKDSVSKYMEELLARNRRQSGQSVVSSPVPVAKATKPETTTKAVDQPTPAIDEVEINTPPVPKQLVRNSAPRQRPDREALIAEMQAMRNVANVSARNAVAIASRKQVKALIGTKGVAAALSIGLGLVAFLLKIQPIIASCVVGLGALIMLEMALSVRRKMKNDHQKARTARTKSDQSSS